MFQWHKERQVLTTTKGRAPRWNTRNSLPHRTRVVWMGFPTDSIFLEWVVMWIRSGNCSRAWDQCVNGAADHSLSDRIPDCYRRGNLTSGSSKPLIRYYVCSPQLLTHTTEHIPFSKTTPLLKWVSGTCNGALRNTPGTASSLC